MTRYWCMREPDRDIIRLGHILTAIASVEEYVSGISEEQLKNDKLRLHALVHDYFRINFDVLWDVVHKDIPLLKS